MDDFWEHYFGDDDLDDLDDCDDDELDQAIQAAKPYVYPTRAELYEALAHANKAAHRAPAVIGTLAYPSKWDMAHRFVDELLNTLVGR